MTGRPETLRQPPSLAELPTVEQLTLDEQIALAEAAVIRRDARIRRRTDSLVRRVKTDALRHAGGGLLIGIAGVALAWWFRRRKAPAGAPAPDSAGAAAPSEPSTGEHIAREAGLSLVALLPLIWPYMPNTIRKSVTPGTAGTILGFAGPIIARLFRRHAPASSQRG